jgi:hypothetical protein
MSPQKKYENMNITYNVYSFVNCSHRHKNIVDYKDNWLIF